MQCRDSGTGELQSVHPDISRWRQVLRGDRVREELAAELRRETRG